MGRRKKIISPLDHIYNRTPEYTLESGRTISAGEVIKIDGIWGTRFKFKEHVIRNDNGKEWIDCYELEKGINCGLRSFSPELIKHLPKKRKEKNAKN
jgi:hypothetical protein